MRARHMAHSCGPAGRLCLLPQLWIRRSSARSCRQRWKFAISGDSRNCGDIVMPAIAAARSQRWCGFLLASRRLSRHYEFRRRLSPHPSQGDHQPISSAEPGPTSSSISWCRLAICRCSWKSATTNSFPDDPATVHRAVRRLAEPTGAAEAAPGRQSRRPYAEDVLSTGSTAASISSAWTTLPATCSTRPR